jgi:hypothetical protein
MFKQLLQRIKEDCQDYLGGGNMARIIGIVIGAYLLIALMVGIWWSREPEIQDMDQQVQQLAREQNLVPVTGFATVAALLHLSETLLDKPGGYLTNDITPPGVWLDNMGNWEFGVLVQVRDLARVLRKDMSRSQSQSTEDIDLTVAEPQFHFDSESWQLPASESEYRRGIDATYRYLNRLSAGQGTQKAHFYARADNLVAWLSEVENRLGSLSRRLSESVGRPQLDLGDEVSPDAIEQSLEEHKTPWLEIDDVFYEARGTTWALVHVLQAVEKDFEAVLRDKNALTSVRQIRLELEATQQAIWSPMILNGSGFGFLANHSLTMSSYLSRASAAVIDLRNLLRTG